MSGSARIRIWLTLLPLMNPGNRVFGVPGEPDDQDDLEGDGHPQPNLDDLAPSVLVPWLRV
jgi:hypothetical protein